MESLTLRGLLYQIGFQGHWLQGRRGETGRRPRAPLHGCEPEAAADFGTLHPELCHQVIPLQGLVRSQSTAQSVLGVPLVIQGEGGQGGGCIGWNRLEAYRGLGGGWDGGLRGRLRLRANGKLGRGDGGGGQWGQAL